jgi:hypothetical protein
MMALKLVKQSYHGIRLSNYFYMIRLSWYPVFMTLSCYVDNVIILCFYDKVTCGHDNMLTLSWTPNHDWVFIKIICLLSTLFLIRCFFSFSLQLRDAEVKLFNALIDIPLLF